LVSFETRRHGGYIWGLSTFFASAKTRDGELFGMNVDAAPVLRLPNVTSLILMGASPSAMVSVVAVSALSNLIGHKGEFRLEQQE